MFTSNQNITPFDEMTAQKLPGRGSGILRRAQGCSSGRKLLSSKGFSSSFLSLLQTGRISSYQRELSLGALSLGGFREISEAQSPSAKIKPEC